MENILAERFGHLWRLSETENGLELRLAGGDGAIIFDTSCDGFALAGSDQPCSLWDADKEGWLAILGGAIPVPGVHSIPVPLIERRNENYAIHYDILGLIYWMLTRIEEIGRTDLDAHNRFPATSSHAYKHGYLERPIVDEWLHVLGQVIQRQWPCLELKKHFFDMKVSHDVDTPSKYGFLSFNKLIRNMAHNVVKKHDLRGAFLAPWVRINTTKQLHSSDPYNTFHWIMDLSERQGLRNAFYFICGHTDPHDADYRIDHPAIRSLMRKIHQRGHEIGLHPSYGTYNKPLIISKEADLLRKTCAQEGIDQSGFGGRMHYLRWEQPTTMRAWADAGMIYDSSLGYADHAGFRCGTCFEYPAFDAVRQEEIKLRIRPLIAMEVTIMSSSYMYLGSGGRALKKFATLKNRCRAVGGTFTLLWHNSEISGNEELYANVLIA